jgi:hypothetical protein
LQSLEDAEPAEYVRMSMSVPIFFQPWVIKGLPGAGQYSQLWDDALDFKGAVPQNVSCGWVGGGGGWVGGGGTSARIRC